MVENTRNLVEKETTIIELRHEGYVWREIATMVDMSIAGVVKAYKRALMRHPVAAIEEHRELELDRLDNLQRTYWQPAVAGNLRAADFVLRVIDKRAKLLGLDAPLKVQAEVVTYDGSDLDREVERVARIIEASTIGNIATITELTDQGEPLGMEEQTGAEGTTTA
jgi:hypothetical protein